MLNPFIAMQLQWQHHGIDFAKAIEIRDRLWDKSPFLSIGAEAIHKEIKATFFDLEIEKCQDVSKLTYLIINDHKFDGDLSFLEECENIEYIEITGLIGEKVTSLEPLRKLTKLKYIKLDYHEINSIEPLSELVSLEELFIFNNPVKSIAPILELTKLKKLKVAFYNEFEFFTFLQNSKQCTIECADEEKKEMYKINWFNDWAFMHEHFFSNDEKTKYIYALVPLKLDDFIQKGLETSDFFEKFKDIATPEICRLANKYLAKNYHCEYSRSLLSDGILPYCEFNIIKKTTVFKDFNFI